MSKAQKLLSAIGLMVLIFGVFMPAALHASEVSVTIDGVAVEFQDQGPVIVDSRTLVPIRGVFEALGFGVDWNPNTLTATLTAERHAYNWDPDARAMGTGTALVEVAITVGSDSFTVNNEVVELEVPAELIGGRTMLPIRAVLESVGHFVDWDTDADTVVIRNLWGHICLENVPGDFEAQLAPPTAGDMIAIIHTNFGEIHLRLFPDLAPLTVENFVTHAQNGFYDGLLFHRVINNFVLQGGCPLNTGFGGESIWGGYFGDEFSADLRHFRGAVSMSNFGPNTNVSRFFITQAQDISPLNLAALDYRLENQDEISPWGGLYYRDVFPTSLIELYLELGGTPHLDFGHAVFGQVFMGMDVVDTIAAMETDVEAGDRPLEDVIIERVEILNFGG